MNPITSIVTGLFKPAADAYGKHVDAKAAQKTAGAKLLQAKADQAHEITLTELEIVVLAKKNEGGTWKDEYALVLGSSPYVLVLFGAVLSAFGLEEFGLGVTSGLSEIKDLGVPVGEICFAAIGAGLGIKFLKR
jgi:hypothetical protein